MKPEEERPGPGRKPEADKKIQVAIYIRKSHVDALGGMTATKMFATEKVEEQAKLIQYDTAFGKKKRAGHV